MQRIWAFLATGLLALGSLQAEYRPPICNFQIGVGYRHDNFTTLLDGFVFNATTDFARPTKESWKFNFKEIQMVESSVALRYTTCLNYYLRLNMDFATTHAGEGHVDGNTTLNGKDKSFSTSSLSTSKNNSLHFSRIKGESKRGHAVDLSGAVGYQFRSNGRRTIITPLVGFAYQEQHFDLRHGNQVIDALDKFPVLGHIPDLHVKVKPHWYGPFIGFDFETQVDIPCVIMYGTAEYHWTQYRSANSWDFANVFVNKWHQNSHGKGVILNGGFSYKLQCNSWITVFGTYRHFYTGKGTLKTVSLENKLLFHKQTFGTFPAFTRSRTNRTRSVGWNSYVFGLSYDYRF